MKKLMIVMGTRPDAIKLCPLVRELKSRNKILVKVCATGQHREMLDSTLGVFSIKPDFDFDVMRTGQSHTGVIARILRRMDETLTTETPDMVMVQGDTATAFSAALAAFQCRIPVAHIEAGLRTYHLHSPFPKELYRESISLMSEYHFAPNVTAKRNLIREGWEEKKILVTGNTVVDALRHTLSLKRPHAAWSVPKGKRLVVFTAHRRENFGEPLEGMFRALKRLAEAHPDIVVLCPLHHNPEVRSAASILRDCEGIQIIEPPDVVSFHRLLSLCKLVLTDSGGVQEEATALGIPTVLMRFSTERTEGLLAGNLKLAGTTEEGIFTLADMILQPHSEVYESMKKPSAVLGKGCASRRIADAIERWI